jgi:phage terminase small subunit
MVARNDPVGVLRNPRHELFAQELAAGKTATEAYVLAGYKPSRPHASHLQHQRNIEQRVDELLAEREAVRSEAVRSAAERLGIDEEWVAGPAQRQR